MRFLGYVVVWHFLFLGDELVVFICSDDRVVIVDDCKPATVHITGDKTNVVGIDKTRVLGCCLGASDSSDLLCPMNALIILVEHMKKREMRDGVQPLICREDLRVYTNQVLLYWFRLDFQSVGEPTLGQRGEQRFGLRSFRRGAAQVMARVGWSIVTIQCWVRWEPAIVAQYVVEAPLVFSTSFVSTMVGGIGMDQHHWKEFAVQQRQRLTTHTIPKGACTSQVSSRSAPCMGHGDVLVFGNDALCRLPDALLSWTSRSFSWTWLAAIRSSSRVRIFQWALFGEHAAVRAVVHAVLVAHQEFCIFPLCFVVQ